MYGCDVAAGLCHSSAELGQYAALIGGIDTNSPNCHRARARQFGPAQVHPELGFIVIFGELWTTRDMDHNALARFMNPHDTVPRQRAAAISEMKRHAR